MIKTYNSAECSNERFESVILRIQTRKKQHEIKLQRFQKVWTWIFRWLVHQINYLYEVVRLKQSFRKNKVLTVKTPFFAIGPFYNPHFICLNIGFLQSNFAWKCGVFNLSSFNWKAVLQFFWEGFAFCRKFFSKLYRKHSKFSVIVT